MAQIAYTENRPKCMLCHLPSFGAFVADTASGEELIFLCAECGFSRIWQRWTGFMSKKLKSLTLMAIFKLPNDKAAKPPRPPLPEATNFVAAEYNATFLIEGDRFSGALDPCDGSQTFATEWAALERARQISHHLAKGIKKPSHWAVQTGITRVGGTNGKHD